MTEEICMREMAIFFPPKPGQAGEHRAGARAADSSSRRQVACAKARTYYVRGGRSVL